jgi:hypothetical protein
MRGLHACRGKLEGYMPAEAQNRVIGMQKAQNMVIGMQRTNRIVTDLQRTPKRVTCMQRTKKRIQACRWPIKGGGIYSWRGPIMKREPLRTLHACKQTSEGT